MALIRFAEGQQRSGSIGATVYSHNRFGAYIRARSVPVNPSTDRQVAIRNATRSITIAWHSTLTEAQRAAWEAYAATLPWQNKFGDAVNLTGLNVFLRGNALLVQNGIARVDVAPAPGSGLPPAELALAVTASEATQQLTIDGDAAGPWLADPGAWQFWYMGLPQTAGIKFFGGPYRQVHSAPAAGPPPFPAVVAAAFPFQEGNRIWVRSRIVSSDGRASDLSQLNFLAIA